MEINDIQNDNISSLQMMMDGSYHLLKVVCAKHAQKMFILGGVIERMNFAIKLRLEEIMIGANRCF